MLKSKERSFMDFLPVKDDPFKMEPEISDDETKYGWAPEAMEQVPCSESFWDSDFLRERENPIANEERSSLIGALLEEAKNGRDR